MPTAGAALALCTLQNIRKMSNLHKNDTNSLEETCIQLSAPALARLRSQRLAGGWLQGTQPRATHFISGCLTSKLQTASAQLAALLTCSLPPCHCHCHWHCHCHCCTTRARGMQGRGGSARLRLGGILSHSCQLQWGRGCLIAAPPVWQGH